jgi:cholesterol 7alpha-monooxygenase
MHFVTNPHNIPSLLKDRNLNFTPVADEISEKAFGHSAKALQILPSKDLHRIYIRGLQGNGLSELSNHYSANLRQYVLDPESKFKAGIPHDGSWCTTSAIELARDAVFFASSESLFGQGFYNHDIVKNFNDYDERFPLFVGGIPGFFMRKAVSARNHLGKVVHGPEHDEVSTLIQLRRELFEKHNIDIADREGMQVAILWASQGNTIPAATWALIRIAQHPQALKAIRDELHQALIANGEDPQNPKFDHATTLRCLPILDSALDESLRLSSSSIVLRHVNKTGVLKLPAENTTVNVRAGDRVCVFPQATHMNPEIYENPEEFVYDRFIERTTTGDDDDAKAIPQYARRKFYDASGKEIKYHLMPFGGGSSMCPGRFFAANEVRVLVGILAYYCDVELADANTPLPGIEKSRAGLGILPPERDVALRIRIRAPWVNKLKQ